MNAIAETLLSNFFRQRFNKSPGCILRWWVDCGAGHGMKCWHWWNAHNVTATPLHHARQKCACNLTNSNKIYFHCGWSIGMVFTQTYVIVWCDVDINDSLYFLFAALAQRKQRHQSSIIDQNVHRTQINLNLFAQIVNGFKVGDINLVRKSQFIHICRKCKDLKKYSKSNQHNMHGIPHSNDSVHRPFVPQRHSQYQQLQFYILLLPNGKRYSYRYRCHRQSPVDCTKLIWIKVVVITISPF